MCPPVALAPPGTSLLYHVGPLHTHRGPSRRLPPCARCAGAALGCFSGPGSEVHLPTEPSRLLTGTGCGGVVWVPRGLWVATSTRKSEVEEWVPLLPACCAGAWSLLRTPGVPGVTPLPDLILVLRARTAAWGIGGDPRGGWAAGHEAFASFSLDPQQHLCQRRWGSFALAALALRRIKDCIGCVCWAGPWGPLGLAHRRPLPPPQPGAG